MPLAYNFAKSSTNSVERQHSVEFRHSELSRSETRRQRNRWLFALFLSLLLQLRAQTFSVGMSAKSDPFAAAGISQAASVPFGASAAADAPVHSRSTGRRTLKGKPGRSSARWVDPFVGHCGSFAEIFSVFPAAASTTELQIGAPSSSAAATPAAFAWPAPLPSFSAAAGPGAAAWPAASRESASASVSASSSAQSASAVSAAAAATALAVSSSAPPSRSEPRALQLLEHLKCVICLGLAVEAKESACCHQLFCAAHCTSAAAVVRCPYCRDDSVEYAPSPLARRMLADVPAECPDGCESAALTVGQLPAHQRTCPAVAISSTRAACAWRGQRDSLQAHLAATHGEQTTPASARPARPASAASATAAAAGGAGTGSASGSSSGTSPAQPATSAAFFSSAVPISAASSNGSSGSSTSGLVSGSSGSAAKPTRKPPVAPILKGGLVGRAASKSAKSTTAATAASPTAGGQLAAATSRSAAGLGAMSAISASSGTASAAASASSATASAPVAVAPTAAAAGSAQPTQTLWTCPASACTQTLWTCPACTLSNDSANSKCAACDGLKPTPPAASASAAYSGRARASIWAAAADYLHEHRDHDAPAGSTQAGTPGPLTLAAMLNSVSESAVRAVATASAATVSPSFFSAALDSRGAASSASANPFSAVLASRGAAALPNPFSTVLAPCGGTLFSTVLRVAPGGGTPFSAAAVQSAGAARAPVISVVSSSASGSGAGSGGPEGSVRVFSSGLSGSGSHATPSQPEAAKAAAAPVAVEWPSWPVPLPTPLAAVSAAAASASAAAASAHVAALQRFYTNVVPVEPSKSSAAHAEAILATHGAGVWAALAKKYQCSVTAYTVGLDMRLQPATGAPSGGSRELSGSAASTSSASAVTASSPSAAATPPPASAVPLWQNNSAAATAEGQQAWGRVAAAAGSSSLSSAADCGSISSAATAASASAGTAATMFGRAATTAPSIAQAQAAGGAGSSSTADLAAAFELFALHAANTKAPPATRTRSASVTLPGSVRRFGAHP